MDTPADDALNLTGGQFASLAAGHGTAEAIRVLARNQAVIRRVLIAQVGSEGPRGDARFTTAWDLLATLSETAPDAFAAALTHPYMRAWAISLAAALRAGGADPVDVHHLEASAAAVAVRAGLDARLPVPVRGGVAPLPGFGALAAGGDDRVWCQTGTVPDRARPLRAVDAAGLRLTIEDTDPYRGCHGHPAPRLTQAEADRWARLLPTAVRFIDEHMPAYAPGLRAGLTTIMPMRDPGDGTLRSASARDAFGAVGVALPDDPVLLALLLVHEFQHVKLGALLDIADLYDPADTAARYRAPWREDPRPFEGLLQGAYAHVAVAEFWRVRRTLADGAERDAAEAHYVRWRDGTAGAIRQLFDSGSLTTLGKQFVEAMGRTLGG